MHRGPGEPSWPAVLFLPFMQGFHMGRLVVGDLGKPRARKNGARVSFLRPSLRRWLLFARGPLSLQQDICVADDHLNAFAGPDICRNRPQDRRYR